MPVLDGSVLIRPPQATQTDMKRAALFGLSVVLALVVAWVVWTMFFYEAP
jgi:hypothetical protein